MICSPARKPPGGDFPCPDMTKNRDGKGRSVGAGIRGTGQLFLLDPPLGRHGVSVPGVLAAKDDLGIGCLLAAVRAGGTDGIARLLLRSFEGNGICSGFHEKDLISL